MPWKRIQDLETRLGVITGQIEEERDDINGKLELLAGKLVKYFGKEVWRLKGSVF
jgi:hypothetical protein